MLTSRVVSYEQTLGVWEWCANSAKLDGFGDGWATEHESGTPVSATVDVAR